jgi:hypothetical protein
MKESTITVSSENLLDGSSVGYWHCSCGAEWFSLTGYKKPHIKDCPFENFHDDSRRI